MERILIVLRGPIDVRVLRRRCSPEVSEPYELAVCHVLPAESDGIGAGLRAQQEITLALRRALGERAESIAVFAVSERNGYDVDTCAREWGATIVDA